MVPLYFPLRAILTPEIISLAKKLLGYEIDTTELNLMPYFQYVMINEKKLNLSKINQDEKPIINKWRKKKFINIVYENRNEDDLFLSSGIYGGVSYMTVTKKFWDAMSEIIYLSYVDID